MAKKRFKQQTKHSKVPKTSLLGDSVEEVIAAALSAAPTATPPVLMKVCRLCETKDGPFLNIFDADKVTAKKVEELMPFGIAENDDLPHNICFRCSAKVEELHEFIQKCIKTQENLRKAMGKQGPLTMKSRDRVLWEKQLHKTNLSSDDICDVLIKRAMEGIPLNASLDEIRVEKPDSLMKTVPSMVSTVDESESDSDEDDDAISLKQVKQAIEKSDEIPPPRVSRASRKLAFEATIEEPKPTTQKMKTYPKKIPNSETKPPETSKAKSDEIVERKTEPIVEKLKETPLLTNIEKKEDNKPTKPFNIMDHISTIKVNQVGVLFQCKLCNRNFLRKDTVMNHGCAKNHGPPKETSTTSTLTPGPPKPSTVQYIKMDSLKKPLSPLLDKTVEKLTEQPLPAKPAATEPQVKPKPRIGPASRVKAKPEHVAEPPPKEAPPTPEVPKPASVSFPAAPSLNSRYKLVPGPNNTFQLVEESTVPVETPVTQPETTIRKRHRDTSHSKSKHSREPIEKSSSPEVIDLDDNPELQREPYPVGLFQPVPHHSSVSPPKPPVPFTTPAMKKQSYTIVQTGNPSKLLISTKPQPVEEPAKKKLKKKIEVEKEPLKVTSEPVSTPSENNRGVFTFVSLNAADILQPSYVLPSNNIIQESQITTSSSVKAPAVEKACESYSCNMCGETFTREKKLLTHIHSHYNQMDEEDERRMLKPGPKRRPRKP